MPTTVHFTDDFDYVASAYTTFRFNKGSILEVEDECADEAVSSGKATYIDGEEGDFITAFAQSVVDLLAGGE